MPRISRIANDTALTNSDKLLGTDVSGSTKNFTLAQLGTFTQANYSNVDIANGANNRIITATDADSLNGEANLTFDGSTLTLTGSGTVSNGLQLTGSHLTLADGVKAIMGADSDFQIYHQPGTHSPDGGTINVGSWIVSDSGNLLIQQSDADQDIIFMNDNGSGGDAIYMTLDGGTKTVDINVPLNVTTDADITGSVKVTQNLRRTITTVTPSSGVSTINLTANDNFIVNLTNESSSLVMTIASENVGQSGVIILKNPSSVGSFAMAALPSNMLTPAGANVNFTTSANDTSVISYVVISSTQALVNYVGEFS
tara:strand:- start:989 stop:1924 length:936 start_codon:yes stop_codon:yes gene_type:complete